MHTIKYKHRMTRRDHSLRIAQSVSLQLRLRNKQTMTAEGALKGTVELALVMLTVVSSGGCVSAPPPAATQFDSPPPQTAVYFYPAQGQSAQQQDRDKYECDRWAVQQSGFDPSQPGSPPHLRVVVAPGPPPGAGVAAGAITGGVLGAAVSRPWEAASGALVGAVAGAAIGGVVESRANEQTSAQIAASDNASRAALLEQRAGNYRRAMSACLEGRGYSVR